VAQRILKIQARRIEIFDADAPTKTQLVWRVVDQGLGISEEVAERLFTPFFTTKSEGMGLGLSLCRTVAEQHGGSLEFEQNSPQGSVFIFTLPLAPT